MKEEVKQGTLVAEGVDDVLTKALGKAEHGGRVRGQGKHVRQSVYFDLPRQKRAKTMDEKIREGVQKFMAEETPRIIKERDAFWATEMEKLKIELLKKVVPNEGSPFHASHQASCSHSKDEATDQDLDKPEAARKICVDDVPEDEKEKSDKAMAAEELEDFHNTGEPVIVKDVDVMEIDKNEFTDERKVVASENNECQLAVGSISNIVAYAKIDEVPVVEGLEQTIHGVRLAGENARVSITKVLQSDAKIPFPIGDEIVTVQEAVGTFVAWPRDMIVVGKSNTTKVVHDPKVRIKSLYIKLVQFRSVYLTCLILFLLI